ncbi:MAG: 4'-phosphopantetheinyl transferase superfamily protein [Neisseriales bacterium]|nr:MAG: 4'-phosphopantetheinyl transferase superfamily protein [Neisseriales bacterium]
MLTVQYCYAFLDGHYDFLLEKRKALSQSDRLRLKTMTHPLRQAQFIAGRLLLQQAAKKAGYAIALTDMAIHPFGHLYLSTDLRCATSITHSHHYVAAAFSDRGTLGIDSEYKKSNRPFLAIARRTFNAQQYRWLVSLPDIQQMNAFYRLWLEKEARYKAGLKNPVTGNMQSWYDENYAHGAWSLCPVRLVLHLVTLTDSVPT